MSESCELLEKCGFFSNFKRNSEVVKKLGQDVLQQSGKVKILLKKKIK